jgi:hypothetical protein
MKIKVYKPDGTFYRGFQDTIPPVTIEIPNPDEGQWTFNVTALDIPHNDYPFSLILNNRHNQIPRRLQR